MTFKTSVSLLAMIAATFGLAAAGVVMATGF